MTPIQWILLILVVAAVAGVYLYIRRQAGVDPWHDMEHGDADAPQQGEQGDADAGVSLNGDSYIVGVRTIGSQDAPPPTAAQTPDKPAVASSTAQQPEAAPADDADWKNFTTAAQAEQPAPADAQVGDMRPRRPPTGSEQLFMLFVTARDEQHFDGPDIHAALQQEKLKFGLQGFYHRITETNGVPESVFSIANMVKPGTLDPMDQDHLRTPGLTLFLVLPGPVDGGPALRDMMETANALASTLGGEVLDDKRSLLKAQTAQYMIDQVVEIDRQQRLQAQR